MALQNGLKWLLLHSWFSNFCPRAPTTLTKNSETWITSINPTTAPTLVEEKEIVVQNICIVFSLHVIVKIQSLWYVIHDFIYL